LNVTCFSANPSEDNVGFTDDNKKWLIPAKKSKLNLSDSDDEDGDVSSIRFIL